MTRDQLRRRFAGAAAVLAAALVARPAAADAPGPAPQTVVQEKVVEERTTTVVLEPAPAAKPAWGYPDHGLVFYPEGPGAGKDRWAVGGIWQIAPMFTTDYRHGLGAGFTIDAELQTIILYNQLGAGAQWAAKVGPFSLGLMLHVNAFLGTLGKAFVQTSSFNAIGWGVLVDPGAKAGLQITKDSWLTLQYEAYLSVYQASQLGNLVLSPNSATYEGFGLSLVVEYSPKMKGVIYYGVSLYNTSLNYPLWFNVEATPSSEPVSSSKIWYLGLLAGYEF